MPVILEPGSEELRTWLDPERTSWSTDLQSLLRPFSGALDIYPVKSEVGKVGNESPSFVIPLDSEENKSNIKNVFARAARDIPKEHTTEGRTDPDSLSSYTKKRVFTGDEPTSTKRPRATETSEKASNRKIKEILPRGRDSGGTAHITDFFKKESS